ncbi:hypothetical protein D4R71_00135 [bacterium]|nr:MAG: hypothetical protein D4R71_00135 [bacterium]
MEYKNEKDIFIRLNQLSSLINSATKFEQILTLTCKTAFEVFNIDHSGVVVFNNNSGEVVAEFPSKNFNLKGTKFNVKGNETQN